MTRIKFHESRVQALVQNPLQVHLIREQIKGTYQNLESTNPSSLELI
jgi:hypothetical protein